MGSGRFAAATKAPQSLALKPGTKVSFTGSTLPPEVPLHDYLPPKVDPAETDDAVTALVKREIVNLQAKLSNVQKAIDQHAYGLREAEGRKRELGAQVARLATFLGSGA